MAHFKNHEDMFLKRAYGNKKDGARFWAMALEAQSKGKPARIVENLKRRARHYYDAAEENSQKAVEHKGKIWEKKIKQPQTAVSKNDNKPSSL